MLENYEMKNLQVSRYFVHNLEIHERLKRRRKTNDNNKKGEFGYVSQINFHEFIKFQLCVQPSFQTKICKTVRNLFVWRINQKGEGRIRARRDENRGGNGES